MILTRGTFWTGAMLEGPARGSQLSGDDGLWQMTGGFWVGGGTVSVFSIGHACSCCCWCCMLLVLLLWMLMSLGPQSLPGDTSPSDIGLWKLLTYLRKQKNVKSPKRIVLNFYSFTFPLRLSRSRSLSLSLSRSEGDLQTRRFCTEEAGEFWASESSRGDEGLGNWLWPGCWRLEAGRRPTSSFGSVCSGSIL